MKRSTIALIVAVLILLVIGLFVYLYMTGQILGGLLGDLEKYTCPMCYRDLPCGDVCRCVEGMRNMSERSDRENFVGMHYTGSDRSCSTEFPHVTDEFPYTNFVNEKTLLHGLHPHTDDYWSYQRGPERLHPIQHLHGLGGQSSGFRCRDQPYAPGNCCFHKYGVEGMTSSPEPELFDAIVHKGRASSSTDENPELAIQMFERTADLAGEYAKRDKSAVRFFRKPLAEARKDMDKILGDSDPRKELSAASRVMHQMDRKAGLIEGGEKALGQQLHGKLPFGGYKRAENYVGQFS